VKDKTTAEAVDSFLYWADFQERWMPRFYALIVGVILGFVLGRGFPYRETKVLAPEVIRAQQR
jgi:hypothetical protein